MNSNNTQISKAPEYLSSIDYSTVSPKTLRNFKDFNIIFRRADDEFFTPCSIADTVVDLIKSEGDDARISDVVVWFEYQVYFQIRHTVDVQKVLFANKNCLPTLDLISECEFVKDDDEDYENYEDRVKDTYEILTMRMVNEYRVNHAYKFGSPLIMLDDIDEADEDEEFYEDEEDEYNRNLRDFDNMFRELDLDNCGRRDVAFKVFVRVLFKYDDRRTSNVCAWIEEKRHLRIERNPKHTKIIPNTIESDRHIFNRFKLIRVMCAFKIELTSNNTSPSALSSETLKNFDDFKNMFKGIDSTNCAPGDVAHKILLKVKLERNQSRYDDVCMWTEFGYFSEIKRNVSLSDCIPADDDTDFISVERGYPVEIDIYYGSDSDSDEVSDIED